jgi:hypothetical protein
MKKSLRTGALALAVLGFVVFFFTSAETREAAGATSQVYRVGLPSSPWLTFTFERPLPGGATDTHYELNALNELSGSWLALAVAIAALWVHGKPAAAEVIPPARP